MNKSFRAILLVFALIVTGCAHVPAPDTANEAAFRVMTFNIRLDTASDGQNAWPERRELVRDLIRHEAPVLLGMQEVLLHQKRYLEEALPGYDFIGVGRDDGVAAGEFSPLAWRRDVFTSIESGTFWLSSTPEVPGKGWDAAYPRVATWAILERRDGGGKVRVLNTHFDHAGVSARTNAARMIAEWVDNGAGAGLPTVVMGDFNADPDSDPYAILVGGTLADSRSVSATKPYGPPGTFTGFDIARAAPMPIDHIFVSPDIVVTEHAVVTQHWGGRLPSDHYPVVVRLDLP
ncbi:endonuclease/exonuclease/phosphatase family protein [Qipengyuania qiaonensis]|uniref:Endonuclease/exonuclease/phosphatase family protein n=1 Tax=Qipengyuania qiaonensis TaxID=2867240 RepID=A0ABS7J8V1_9SPHN|nr:endonuclease/exonuclease/phosphatase family protein [Qipengyuania qiaonensis]MBX7483744.1 endonuclease/exonuclease/phosphatase family protein [Qipengyuania qiaonensis]